MFTRRGALYYRNKTQVDEVLMVHRLAAPQETEEGMAIPLYHDWRSLAWVLYEYRHRTFACDPRKPTNP